MLPGPELRVTPVPHCHLGSRGTHLWGQSQNRTPSPAKTLFALGCISIQSLPLFPWLAGSFLPLCFSPFGLSQKSHSLSSGVALMTFLWCHFLTQRGSCSAVSSRWNLGALVSEQHAASVLCLLNNNEQTSSTKTKTKMAKGWGNMVDGKHLPRK